eukprot:gene7650-5133_t
MAAHSAYKDGSDTKLVVAQFATASALGPLHEMTRAINIINKLVAAGYETSDNMDLREELLTVALRELPESIPQLVTGAQAPYTVQQDVQQVAPLAQ